MIMSSLHWIWRYWVYIIFRFMQIVINNSSSMKPLNALNNLIYTKIIPCPVLNFLTQRYGMAKELASFS